MPKSVGSKPVDPKSGDAKSAEQKPVSLKPIEIGAYAAKTHLPRLLREVAAGQSFTITVRGKPVAELKPRAKSPSENPNAEFVRKMREFMKRPDRPSLTAEQIKEMIEYGRR